MNKSAVGLGMRYEMNEKKYEATGGVEMTGKGELWHT